MVGGVGTPADDDMATCDWQIRDRDGWRDGVVFSASASLLGAWHAASVTMPPQARAVTDKQLRGLVDRVRQARLTSDVDDIESACQTLLRQAAGRPMPAQLRRALADLVFRLTND
jgi:hypothetical protein